MAIPMHGSRGLIWIHVPSLHSGILEPSQSKQIFHRPWIYRAADYTVPSQFLHKCRWYGRSQRKRGNPSPAELEQEPELQLLTPVLRPHCLHCWLRTGFPCATLLSWNSLYCGPPLPQASEKEHTPLSPGAAASQCCQHSHLRSLGPWNGGSNL